MVARQALTVKIRIAGLRETLRAFRELPNDASAELRKASQELAEKLVPKVRADLAAHGGPQGPLLATTVRSLKDRVPVIQAGGTTRLGRHGTPAYGMLFAAVFGMDTHSGWYAQSRYRSDLDHQYRPWAGQNAYAFFPVVEQNAAEIAAAWNHAADRIVEKFSSGPDGAEEVIP